MSTEQRVSDLEVVVGNIISDATKIGGLQPLASLVNLNDEIALEIKATGQTLKTSISQLISGGVGTSVIKHIVNVPFSFPLNNKTDLDNLHGTLQSFAGSGIILNSGTPITWTLGQSRVFFNVIAGTDVIGDLTITGTSVDRDTGVETASDTEVVTINGVTTDTSSTDSNGNTIHGFANAYISSKWFTGALTISTTDLDISNVTIYQCGYEQFADSENVQLKSFDTTYDTLNTGAEMDMYLYSVEVVGNVTTVQMISQQNQATGGAVRHYRHKRALTKNLDGTTDGIFIDLFLNPINQPYFSSYVTKVWAEITENVNIVVDGSLGLDNITYGESLQIGDLAYLKSDGKYYKADNTAESTSTTELRLIIEAGVLDDVKLALAKGQYSGAGFTAGLEYVGTSGAITSTRPLLTSETVRVVSTSIDATTRYFDPSKTWINGDASKINGVSLPGVTNEFLDGVYRLLNSADQTKELAFDLSAITSGLTRTASLQDKNGIIAYLSDLQTIVDGEISIHNQPIASTTWNFNHALDFLNPAIQVWDSTIAGAKVIIPLEIIAVDADNCQITFPEAVSGRAVATRGGTNTASLTSDINTLAKLNAVVADATLVDENHVHSANEVSIALGVGSPTVDQIQEYLDNTGSSGFFLDGDVSDGGAGLLNVAGGSGFTRATNDNNAPLLSFKWTTSNGLAVTDNTTQYVYVSNAGVISLDTNEFLETPNKIQIGLATKESGLIVNTFNLGVRLSESIGQAGRFIRRVHGITRDVRKGGLIFGQSGDVNRDVSITAGVIWWGRTEYPFASFNTSGADTFETYSANGQEASAASQFPNTQYDNAGTLTTLANNRWANLFFYIIPNNGVVMVYGRSQFTSQAIAELEGVPSSSLPTKITETGLLAARFTFQESVDTAIIKSSFDTLFANAGVTDHGDLAGLVDDDHTQYLLTDGSRTLSIVDAENSDRIYILDASDSNILKKAYIPENQIAALGDETTAIETGTAILTFTMPNYATKLTHVSGSLTVAPTGSTAIFDINEGGTTVLSTKISIDISEFTSETAATAPIISDSSIAANAILTVDFDQVGSTIAGAGAKFRIYYTRA